MFLLARSLLAAALVNQPTDAPQQLSTPRLLTVIQAAETLGVSTCTIYRLKTVLGAVRIGRSVRFDPELLSAKFHATIAGGKSLMPERKQMLSRYQQGTVALRGKRTKMWYGTYREDVRLPDGGIARKQRVVRLGSLAELPTKNAARRKLTERIDAPVQNATMTFRELAERWEAAEGPTKKAQTLGKYQDASRVHLHPVFGDRDIKTITREEIQRLLARKAVTHGRSSLKMLLVSLSLILGWATDCQMLERNPCNRIRLPLQTGGRRVTRNALAFEQVAAIADNLEEPYATLVLLLATTGLRIGEAIAVKWSDFEGNRLRITRNVYNRKVGTPKTKTSVRDVYVSSELLERMQRLGNKDWVFCTRAGTPIDPRNALRRYIHPAAKCAGVPLSGWHDFRHTVTTKLHRDGVHPKVIANLLGHSKVGISMDVYTHTTLADSQMPMQKIADELLSSVSKMPASV